jgi:hypothetical protein
MNEAFEMLNISSQIRVVEISSAAIDGNLQAGFSQQSREVPKVTGGVRAGSKRHFFGGIRWVRSGGGWFDMVTLLSALDGVMMLLFGRVWETHVIVMEDGDGGGGCAYY